MSEKLKSGGMTASEEARFKQFDEKLHKLQNRLTKGNLEAGDKGHNQTAAMAEHMTTIWDKKVAQKKDPLPPAPVSKPVSCLFPFLHIYFSLYDLKIKGIAL